MRNTLQLIDANVILRYLVMDHAEMALIAKETIDQGAYTTAEVLAEVIYVLRGVYHVPKEQYCEKLRQLLNDVGIEHKEAILSALDFHESENLDFVDCILMGRHFVNGEHVFTFDEKLKRALRTQ